MANKSYEETGRLLMEIRLASGCGVPALAEQTGVSRSMIQAVEAGMVAAPRALLVWGVRMEVAGPARVRCLAELEARDRQTGAVVADVAAAGRGDSAAGGGGVDAADPAGARVDAGADGAGVGGGRVVVFGDGGGDLQRIGGGVGAGGESGGAA